MKNPTSTARPTIHWQGEPHPELEESIFYGLRQWGIYDEGDDLSGLIYYEHFVTPGDVTGPSVDLRWQGDKLVAIYTARSTWVSVGEAAKKLTQLGNEGKGNDDEDDGA